MKEKMKEEMIEEFKKYLKAVKNQEEAFGKEIAYQVKEDTGVFFRENDAKRTIAMKKGLISEKKDREIDVLFTCEETFLKKDEIEDRKIKVALKINNKKIMLVTILKRCGKWRKETIPYLLFFKENYEVEPKPLLTIKEIQKVKEMSNEITEKIKKLPEIRLFVQTGEMEIKVVD